MTWLQRCDPRVKLYFLALGIGLCLMIDKPLILVVLLSITHIFLLTGGIAFKKILSIWQELMWLILIILVFHALFLPLSVGIEYTLKFTTAAFFVMVLILTTPMHKLVRGLEKLGLSYSISMTIGMALQYFKTLGELYTRILEAQQARGWDAAEQGLIRRLRAVMPRLVALIIASIRISDSLASGLASRGFGAGFQRTIRQDIIMTYIDWMLVALFTIGFLTVVFLDWMPA